MGPQFGYRPRPDVRLSEQPRTGRAAQVAKGPNCRGSTVKLPNAGLPVLDIGLARNKDIDWRVVRKLPWGAKQTFFELRATAFQRFVTYCNLAHATATQIKLQSEIRCPPGFLEQRDDSGVSLALGHRSKCTQEGRRH